MKKLVIFDLDGTLINSIDDLGNATNYALSQLGYPEHPLSAYPAMVGNGVNRLLARALPSGHDTEERIAQMWEIFKGYYDSHSTDLTRPYPGIPELLHDLRDRDINVAVASNKYQEAVEPLVAKLFPGIDWAAIEGNKSGFPTKPDPSIVFEILSKVPTPKAEVAYVGDSGVDMETARRACVDSIGVTWGYRPVSELKSACADTIVSSPADILEIVIR